MKYIALALFALLLTGCGETRTEEVQARYQMPDGMHDCQVFDMVSQTAQDIIVVRCPLSSTSTSYSYTSGKTTHERRSVVVDGVTFIEESGYAKDPTQPHP